ncbi:hypothetical protein [Demequina sp.]|uniref:hypothetical protein n=1 Tax=Demequina sp. TaxID=2050685 RepID=UPI0025E9BE6F|nr:hypothetical protein [Demequina sp.]
MTTASPDVRSSSLGTVARILLTAGAVLGLIVSILYSTTGDHVTIDIEQVSLGRIADLSHAVAWYLATVAFALGAIRGTWARASTALISLAGVAFSVFLVITYTA